MLWTHYENQLDGQFCPGTGPDGCNHESIIPTIRLINPNGAANGNLAGAKEQTVCAMIYVFDDDEEMGECCGCPLSSAQLATFSVEFNLLSNWGLTGGPEGGDHGEGPIALVAASPNTVGCLGAGGGKACNGGCDPTNVPGYSVSTANNLLGSITHLRAVAGLPRGTSSAVSIGITEVALFDDAGGDPTNLAYLRAVRWSATAPAAEFVTVRLSRAPT